jgi:hypothetical protein
MFKLIIHKFNEGIWMGCSLISCSLGLIAGFFALIGAGSSGGSGCGTACISLVSQNALIGMFFLALSVATAIASTFVTWTHQPPKLGASVKIVTTGLSLVITLVAALAFIFLASL